jgi:hypothetical protein
VNIRLQITITDQGGTEAPSKKVVTMILADRASGSIRSEGTQLAEGPLPGARGQAPVSINLDAQPTILKDGGIRLNLGLEYWPLRQSAGGADAEPSGPTRGRLSERLGLIVSDGKPVVISEAADAATNRKVTVELVATILK